MRQTRRFQIRLVAIVALLGGWCALPAMAEPEIGPMADLQAIQNAFQVLAEKVAPSVVTLRATYRSSGEATTRQNDVDSGLTKRPWRSVHRVGSGAIIRSDGMILTSEHLVYQAETIIVHLCDDRELLASIIQTDPRSDLAVLKVEASGLQAVVLGDATTLRQGHLVFPFGNPLGAASTDTPPSMNWGVVSALGRTLPTLSASEGRYYGDLIETTAAIIPGHSGGPLFNIHGEVVGVSTAIRTRTGRSGGSEGLGLFVPINEWTRRIIETLMKGQEVEYGMLGVVFPSRQVVDESVMDTSKRRGAPVSAVEPDSPAERADLRSGDVIVTFDGQEVRSADHLTRLVGAARPGRRVEIVYDRHGRRRTATVIIARREQVDRAGGGSVHWRGLTLQQVSSHTEVGSPAADKDARGVRGLIVVDVRPNSSADRAGCRRGLVLDRIGPYSVQTAQQFRNVARQYRDRPVEVTVRGGMRFELQPN